MDINRIPEGFTPGPWRVKTSGNLLRVIQRGKGGDTVCGVHRLGIAGGRHCGDKLANAALIALAPEMATALRTQAAEIEALRTVTDDMVRRYILAENNAICDDPDCCGRTNADEPDPWEMGVVRTALIAALAPDTGEPT
jgi:hypothetical protein